MRIFKSEDLHKMEMHYACGDTGNRAEWFVCHAEKRVAADAVSRFYCIAGDGRQTMRKETTGYEKQVG